MSDTDLSGRSRIAKNAIASYAGHFVFIFFGFVTPRIVDAQVGQMSLGVWDFCWSLVHYLNLSMIGIGSSVNRYVARYRSQGDNGALNRLVSTVSVLQAGIGVFALTVALLLSFAVPHWFADRLGAETDTAVKVIRYLGAALAVQMTFDVWRGVLSGCHRWDYYNALNAGGYAIASVSMIVALLMGGGLAGMALMYLVVTFLTEIARYKIARRVCPEIDLQRRFSNKADANKVAKFRLKRVMLGVPALVSVQTVNIFVVANLGPAALAIMARPVALVNHVNALVGKFSNILAPTAGSLQSQDKSAELQEFALQASRAGWLLAIPPLCFLFVLGDMVVNLWMGPNYANWTICAILAAGQLLPISQGPLMNILVGLNAHGTLARVASIVTITVLGVGLLVLSYTEWTLAAAASLVALSLGLGLGLSTLIFGFRYLKISLPEYLQSVGLPAATLLVATVAALYGVRQFSGLPPGSMVLLGMAVTAAVFFALNAKDTRRVLVAIRS